MLLCCVPFLCSFYACFRRETLLKYRKTSLIVSAIVWVSFFIYKHWFNELVLATNYLTSTANMGVLRVVNAVAIVCFCLSLNIELNLGFFTRFFSWIGRNALAIFCLHVVSLYIHLLFFSNPSRYWEFDMQVVAYLFFVLAPFSVFYVFDFVRGKWNFGNLKGS